MVVAGGERGWNPSSFAITHALTLRGRACKLAAASSHARPPIVTSKKSSPDPEGTAPAQTAPPADFERSLSELEAIVEQLEQGDLSLDDSLRQFERGVQLTRACQSALKQAEQKVEILLRKTGQADGFETAEFDADDE
jgi:exodeoxyribonuclease VII small subunit